MADPLRPDENSSVVVRLQHRQNEQRPRQNSLLLLASLLFSLAKDSGWHLIEFSRLHSREMFNIIACSREEASPLGGTFRLAFELAKNRQLRP